MELPLVGLPPLDGAGVSSFPPRDAEDDVWVLDDPWVGADPSSPLVGEGARELLLPLLDGAGVSCFPPPDAEDDVWVFDEPWEGADPLSPLVGEGVRELLPSPIPREPDEEADVVSLPSPPAFVGGKHRSREVVFLFWMGVPRLLL